MLFNNLTSFVSFGLLNYVGKIQSLIFQKKRSVTAAFWSLINHTTIIAIMCVIFLLFNSF